MLSGTCTAFNGPKIVASGPLRDVVLKAKEIVDRDEHAQILIFDDLTSELIDADFRGAPEQIAKRLDRIAAYPASGPPSSSAAARRPGRPKLGVVPREVTLLPRHWGWLASQPGGASVALRKLVEHAMKANRDRDQVRQAQESLYRFVSAMAGDEPGYEEAIRALFSGQRQRFDAIVEPWPAGVRDHAKRLAFGAFSSPNQEDHRAL
jgi:uncharacterized protein